MMRTKIFLLSSLIAAVSLTFALCFAAPHQNRQQTQVDILSQSFVESTPIPDKVALLEPLTLTLDLPSVVRLGDIEVFRMTIALDARGNVTVATNEPDAVPIAKMSDVFDSYNVIAEARLDLPRLDVSPSDKISQPIHAGQSVTFTWSARADTVGEYEGTAWFFLRFVPKGGNADLAGQVNGPGRELAVAAVPVDLRVKSLFGMNGFEARVAGTIGLSVCFLLALPLLLDNFYQRKK